MTTEIINGDCLIELPKLAARGVVVDACITDPPYGTTACAWDAVIPFEPMWANLKQLVKPSGAIVLFGSQPFTSALVMSNPKQFRYQWVWEKSVGTGFLDADEKPLKCHEDITVFYDAQPAYSPQMWQGQPNHGTRPSIRATKSVYRGEFRHQPANVSSLKYPRSVLKFDIVPPPQRHHINEKPVALMRYLVRTYTNPGDTVLDFTAGSFTTGVACVIEGRNFIGIEQSEDYCRIGEARIQRAKGIPATIPRLNRRQVETLPLFEGAA